MSKNTKQNSVAEILYGAKTKKDLQEKEERNRLLNELGDNLSPKQILYSKIDELRQIKGGIDAFRKNYHDIKEANTKNADKYFHAKANCQISQYGEKGNNIARKLSDLRENVDLQKNKYKKKKDGTKMTVSEIIEDYRTDHSANMYGRMQGLKNREDDCRILVDKYRSRGLSTKY